MGWQLLGSFGIALWNIFSDNIKWLPMYQIKCQCTMYWIVKQTALTEYKYQPNLLSLSHPHPHTHTHTPSPTPTLTPSHTHIRNQISSNYFREKTVKLNGWTRVFSLKIKNSFLIIKPRMGGWPKLGMLNINYYIRFLNNIDEQKTLGHLFELLLFENK